MTNVLMENVAYVTYVDCDTIFYGLNLEGARGRIVEENSKEITQQGRNMKELNCKNLPKTRKGTVHVCINLEVSQSKGSDQKQGSNCPNCCSLISGNRMAFPANSWQHAQNIDSCLETLQ